MPLNAAATQSIQAFGRRCTMASLVALERGVRVVCSYLGGGCVRCFRRLAQEGKNADRFHEREKRIFNEIERKMQTRRIRIKI